MHSDHAHFDTGLFALSRLHTRLFSTQPDISFSRLSILSMFFVSTLFLVIPLVFITLKSRRKESTPPGFHKLGLGSSSNIADQYHAKYSRGVPEQPGRQGGTVVGSVKALFIHPIKSCAPVELGQGTVVAEGMQYDRVFAFAIRIPPKDLSASPEDGTWAFLTQRAKSKMACVKVDVWVPDSPLRENDQNSSQGYLTVSFPKPDVTALELLQHRLTTLDPKSHPTHTFSVPFAPTPKQIEHHNLALEHMRIWKDSPLSLNVTPLIPPLTLTALKATLNIDPKVHLALFRVHTTRPVFRDAPSASAAGYQPRTGFQDGYPLHLNNLASIRAVAARLPRAFGPLTATRYRANILLAGPAPFAEDAWKRLRIGGAEYYVASRNPRCPLPNVDPATGSAARLGTPLYNQPLKTLREFRVVDAGSKSPMLGMNLVPADPGARAVRVGDQVEVLETGEHVYTGM